MVSLVFNIICLIICYVFFNPTENDSVLGLLVFSIICNIGISLGLLIENIIGSSSRSVELVKPYLLFIPIGGLFLVGELGIIRSIFHMLIIILLTYLINPFA